MRCTGRLVAPLVLAGSASASAADPIPPERRVDWSEVGVPGGIPERNDVCATIDAATYGTMAVDAAPAILQAIADCPTSEDAPKVIEIPAGDYLVGSSIDLGEKSWLTIRGAGASQTRLVPAGRTFRLGWGSATPIAATVTSGATRGSTQLTLSSTEGVFEGGLLAIDRVDDPALVFSTSGPGRYLRQLLRVTAISGNDVTFEPPLFWDFDDAPQITGFADMMTQGVGIEDMLFDHEGQGEGPSVFFDQCYGCWVRGIHSRMTLAYHTVAANSMRCEIRDSFYADSQTYGSNNAGVALYGMNVGWKIENNIFFKTFPGIEAQNGTSANYFGYNFGEQVEAGWENSGAMFSDNHGPHDMMNLWEGNVGEMFQSDGYFGSGSHATLFRNHFTAQNAAKQGNFKAVSLERWTYHYNIVGNLLGGPDTTYAYYEAALDNYGLENATIYRLGYPNIGNNSQQSYDGMGPTGLDPMVAGTLLRVGNYDYFHGCIWDDDADACLDAAAATALALPDSLYYADEPAWWPAGKPWPPFAPERDDFDAAMPVHIPAHDCFDLLDLANGGAFDRETCYADHGGADETGGSGSDDGTAEGTAESAGSNDGASGSGGTTTAGSAGVDTDGSTDAGEHEGGGGCGCTTDPPRPTAMLVLLGLLRRRRR
jgi:MYXO-CTERM domain-containing protein